MSNINLFTILPLVCALFVLLFGLFILSKAPKSRMNRLLFGFNVSMFFWMFGTFMMFANRDNAVLSIFWDRFVYMGVVFMPPFMHHFSLLFTNRDGKQKTLLKINYLVAILFLFLSQTPYFLEDLYYYSWGVHTQARLLHHVFLGYFFLGTGIFFVNIWTYFKKIKSKEIKIQSIYVFIAFAIVIFIGGTAYLLAYNIDTKFPFAYFTGLIFPFMLAYAVTKHHLLGTKVVVTEVLVGLTVFILVSEIFLSRSVQELLLRIVFAVVVVIIGVLLIKSVNREINRREEVTKLAHSLEKANLRLKEVDRQKTDFLSIASHQLRTPLSIAKGYIELIQDGAYGKITKKANGILNDMNDSNEHLVKLVDEFLDITRIEQGRTKFSFVKININKLSEGVVKELTPRAKDEGLKLVWKSQKNLKEIEVDEEKVRHVVFNFIDNAIKYTDKGVIIISSEKEENGVTVKVKDKGFGFGKEDEANFFQKFYRGKNVEGTNVTGTGLGLYVCRKFIESHGGHVWAHSKGLGKGSEFGFWIPYGKKIDKTASKNIK